MLHARAIIQVAVHCIFQINCLCSKWSPGLTSRTRMLFPFASRKRKWNLEHVYAVAIHNETFQQTMHPRREYSITSGSQPRIYMLLISTCGRRCWFVAFCFASNFSVKFPDSPFLEGEEGKRHHARTLYKLKFQSVGTMCNIDYLTRQRVVRDLVTSAVEDNMTTCAEHENGPRAV
jgi:hypothetical protein